MPLKKATQAVIAPNICTTDTNQTITGAAKQALRDVTLTPLPDNLAGIKATWPNILID